ncbi:MAG: hypothetical protein AB7O62_25255 [Pirellulales bacterium]
MVPSLEAVEEYLSACREDISHSPTLLLSGQNSLLSKLAPQARAELREAAWEYTRNYRDAPRPPKNVPIVLAGHQPQMFHPGVWCKNFLLSRLAQQGRATAINLVVDNDTLKGASLRVPGGSADNPQSLAVDFDAAEEPVAFEERRIADPATFASFGQRATEILAPFVEKPLLEDYWPMVQRRSQETNRLGECLAQARHQLEAAWGLQTLELPLCVVCGLPAFHLFVSHLLNRGAEFRAVHNGALAAYRQVRRIRSTQHPVPELARDGDWFEAPFWVWTNEDTRRRRLFARSAGRDWLLTDRGRWQTRLPAAVSQEGGPALEALIELAQQGVKLRTRALTTTLWARLFLGDLFVHGIGGAKYDELTDDLIRAFFKVPPPRYLVATGTLRLPIAREQVTADDVLHLDAQLRDMRFHPEQFIAGEVASTEIAAKQAAVALPANRASSKARGQAIRSANEALQPFLRALSEQKLAERSRLAARWRAEAVLASREFGFPLFPICQLKDFLLEFPSQKAYT